MSLKTEIQADLAEAMNEDLAEAVVAFTYTVPVNSSNYNPTTGQVSPSGTTAGGRGIMYDLSLKEITNLPPLKNVSKRAVVLQNELSLTPEVDGTLDCPDGVYAVLHVMPDPVGATWELYLGLHNPTEV